MNLKKASEAMGHISSISIVSAGQIKVLRDDAPDSDLRPTRIKILQHGFEELLRDLEGGEILFFYFSGKEGRKNARVYYP